MTLGERVRADFPILERTIGGRRLVYLDSAATAQKPRTVLDALRAYYERSNANVHRSIHTLGEEATELFEAARDRVRTFIGARHREEVIFTKGTTEAINLVAHTWARPALAEGDEILLTEMEHHSNLVPWFLLARERKLRLRYVPVTEDGHLDLDALDRLLTRRTRLVALTHVSNVLGTVNPVAEIVERAQAAGARVLIDGAQAAPHLPVDVAALGVDFYAFSGHKLGAPTGIGVLYGRREILEPLEPAFGGSEIIKEVWLDRVTWNDLPWRFEPGTPPIAGAIGLGAAIAYLEGLGWDAIRVHEAELTCEALARLPEVEDLQLYGPLDRAVRLGVVSFNLPGIHPHDLAAALDSEGIAVRAGHHCAQPLMRRLGVVGTARASFYLYTTPDDIAA
ncbi:MAG: cysteine desulfurase, partial [Candidatus Rokubacteria bacterium]|nr:cysteine desulfurase [Candidatus Rokubacteria bacterium]